MGYVPKTIDDIVREHLARGDRRGALTILMDHYGTDIYRFCFSVVRHHQDAEDVHQTVFVQVYQALVEVDRGCYRAWLIAIARNRCIDRLREKGCWDKRIEQPGNLPDVPDPGLSGEELLGTRTLVDLAYEFLGKLDARTRLAVILHYQEGYSYPEIARILREAPATIQVRVRRALADLRGSLVARGVRT